MALDISDGWSLYPLGGNTGTAFMGTKASQKVFLKQNASPFLAALSMEGITPRLVWTKRLASGDVMTAQEWLNGRTLRRSEMREQRVARLLHRVHHSNLLHDMLLKVGGRFTTPAQLLTRLQPALASDLRQHPLIQSAFVALQNEQPQLPKTDYEVCHGDLNHKNWLLSDRRRLYLVDWDSASFADPAYDLGALLCEYVPLEEWQRWLQDYGERLTPDLLARVNWYARIHCLTVIADSFHQQRFQIMNQHLILLEKLTRESVTD
ncbi:choline kinase-like enzyme [Levilactobacillus senmaizukei DSM 21775 = NBRC 103853]|uniref:Choline kinase-like enzyme n=1 Tax=Levilactobacillus senmaizukei DSM 21775 = NBRC 103853 TaxID=1423803 RepID=A0A0R2DQE7_9LACO|nr:phosphotransferase family protein [Levilactobacillus senmaizukei]KRN02100.1 choline kinase-like enzyme [Levilactobacillus senmaizukei DSM 21775 = NBRC 103853]